MTSRFRPLLPFLDVVTIRRFASKITRTGPDNCWPWQGQVNNQGYGRFDVWAKNQRTRLLAHRVAFTIAHGDEIGRRVLMHSCDNPPCCNPRHLQPGSQTDNMRDALRKGRSNLTGLDLGRLPGQVRAPKRLKTHCKRGHEFNEANTRHAKHGRVCKPCRRINARDQRQQIKPNQDVRAA